jgi:AraC-like DNA-binding protein
MDETQTAIVLARFPLGAGQGFDEHTHDHHQLAWVRDGVLMVTVGEQNWILPPSLALWIPAGIPHSSSAVRSAATMQGIYLSREARPEWTSPTVVGVSTLLRELIDLLCAEDAPSGARAKAEALVPELLAPARTLTVAVPMPRDERAARIASELLLDPGDSRDLAGWGRHVGASARTLSRIFAAETELGFAQWRSRLRLRASLAYLAEGESVGTTAMLVGFGSTSAFIAAFSALMGVTPGAYFAQVAQLADQRHEMSV